MSNNFKIGNIVKCVDNDGFWTYITEGKSYEVIEVYIIGENNIKSTRKRPGLRVICDNNHKRGFSERRFVLDVKATRDKEITGILC